MQLIKLILWLRWVSSSVNTYLLSLLPPAVAARFSGKLEKRRPNKQLSAEPNVRFTKIEMCFHLPICSFTVFCITQKYFKREYKLSKFANSGRLHHSEGRNPVKESHSCFIYSKHKNLVISPPNGVILEILNLKRFAFCLYSDQHFEITPSVMRFLANP